MLLTPTKPVPHAWFGDLRGKRVLGLASGGGQQMPVFAAIGASEVSGESRILIGVSVAVLLAGLMVAIGYKRR